MHLKRKYARGRCWGLVMIGLVIGAVAVWVFLPIERGDDAAPVRQQTPDVENFSGSFSRLSTSEGLAALSPVRHLQPIPSDASENEVILRFGSAADYEDFINAARKNKTAILGTNDFLRSVRMNRDALQYDRELWDLAEDADWEHNYFFRAPEPVQRIDIGNHRPFGNAAAAMAGFPNERSNWGEGVRIAILDTAIAHEHPAFDSRVVQRFDYLSDASLGQSIDGGHGTAMASIIIGDLEYGLGLAPAADLLHYRVLDNDGFGNSFDIAHAIVSAVDNGARVINMSFGGTSVSGVVADAIEYAHSKSVIMVGAAGNQGIDGPLFPARLENVIAVGAVDANGSVASFSNRGADLMAPGVGIPSAWNTEDDPGGSAWANGTSPATAIVTGAIAGLLSTDPTLRADDIVQLLATHADDSGAIGADSEFGNGTLNVARVLQRDERGIRKVAVSGVWIEDSSSDSGMIRFGVSAQNRGTESAAGVTLNIRVAGSSTVSLNLGDLRPAETRGHVMEARSEIDNEQDVLRVEAWVETAGQPAEKDNRVIEIRPH